MENSNETQQEIFYRYRGVNKCLGAGISFLTDNFLRIVKVSAPFALSYSLIMSALVFITSNSSLMQAMTGSDGGSNISRLSLSIILIVLYLLLFVSVAMFTGFIMRMTHIHAHNIPLSRYKNAALIKSALPYGVNAIWFSLSVMVLMFLCAAIAILPNFIGGEGTIFTVIRMGVLAVIATLALVFALPFNVAFPAMYLGDGRSIRNAIYGYKKGLKVWGKVFGLVLLSYILVGVLMFVFYTPSLTMISAYKEATLSQLNGDPVHMPAGYSFWYAIVLFITYYLTSFLYWIQLVPFAYLYASIKCDEIEEAKNQLIN